MEPKAGRGLNLEVAGELKPESGETCARFRLQIWGIETTEDSPGIFFVYEINK